MGWREAVKREYQKYHEQYMDDDLKYIDVNTRLREIKDGIQKLEENREGKSPMQKMW